VILVYAKTAPDKGPKGISAFLVEKSMPGFSVAQKLVKMAVGVRRPASSSSTTAACLPGTAWARRTRAS